MAASSFCFLLMFVKGLFLLSLVYYKWMNEMNGLERKLLMLREDLPTSDSIALACRYLQPLKSGEATWYLRMNNVEQNNDRPPGARENENLRVERVTPVSFIVFLRPQPYTITDSAWAVFCLWGSLFTFVQNSKIPEFRRICRHVRGLLRSISVPGFSHSC